MASARPTTFDRRNAGAHVRHPRRSPLARRKKPCSANIFARRTPRSRRATCISGRRVRRQCRPLPLQSGFPRPLISSSLALLTLPQPLHVSNGPPDQFLNAFIVGRRCCRIPFEKEPPLLHHLDPCSRRFRQHLVFETTEVRLCRAYPRRGVARRSPPHFRLMSAGLCPATVKIDRVIRHSNAPKKPHHGSLAVGRGTVQRALASHSPMPGRALPTRGPVSSVSVPLRGTEALRVSRAPFWLARGRTE
ncbi:hypothetical protein SAMN04488239_11181 [Ruegeria marina]|uniref:Uncharacterized protein n=1 Tax=Ruegeria marina TaxID=639004 RepID=A0A1G6YAV5_9RHOB|nr:hypothetical protein SAMN04488239_11181 [Ruegeria marina]